MSATVRLTVGSLLADGTLTPGSMARAIDDALTAQVPVGAGEDPNGRRKLALAIAQGVIAHLDAQQDAFVVSLPGAGLGTVEHFVRIDTA